MGCSTPIRQGARWLATICNGLTNEAILGSSTYTSLSLSLTQIPSVALIGEKWKMVIQEFAVDLNKPLVFQVGHLEEHYQEWVHQPVVSKEGPHFFANDTMEFLTRTKWWAVPVIWLPAVCWLFAKSIRMGHTIQEVILMALFGVFVWTLIEYSLHRFLFHIERKSYWVRR